MNKFINKYDEIITIPNVLSAWNEFLLGKKKRIDVIVFQARLTNNILDLYNDLKNRTYKHGEYKSFNISDPKPRNIHKATVRDRLLHHLLYRETYLYFDKKFIFDSYSCRLNKGTHKAIYRLSDFIRRVSNNFTTTSWVLKCDIKKFFASIDHSVLKGILKKYIYDKDLLWLFSQVINSFETVNKCNKGLPLGNLTSQLLVNIYMNEFDQFVKRDLKVKFYIRYADDFILLSQDKEYLKSIKNRIQHYLFFKLKLSLHEDKVFLKTVDSGVDFLGWNHFEGFRVLRTVSRRRMFKKIKKNNEEKIVNSYLGLLTHGNTYNFEKKIIKERFL
jgi:RNA-directed DNA polymerase